MKKIINLTAFLSLTSIQCVLAQVALVTPTPIEQNIPGDSFSISYLGVTPKLMMNPSTEEEGIKAMEKVLGISPQGAAIEEGTAVEHQTVGVVAEIRETPIVSVSSGSNEVEMKRFSNASSQVLKSEEESDNSEELKDPDLESEDNGIINSQINKYLKNEIINNIYTECLAEVAKFSLEGRVTAENASKEIAEWAAAKAAAEYYIRKYERESRVCGREENKAKEIAEECKRKAEGALTVSKKAKELDQLEAKVVLARAAYAESDYEFKKLALQLAEARVGTAHATLYAIEVKNNPSRGTAEVELAECQKIESDVLEAFTKAKVDFETKASLLSAAEEALTVARHQGFSTGAKSATNEEAESTENMKASGEVESIAEAPIIREIQPPILSDDIAEEIGSKLLGKKISKKDSQEFSTNLEDETRWDAREKADQLAKQVAIAKAHMKRWQKKYATSQENSSALISMETRSRADSTASVQSALGSIDDSEEGKIEESMDPEMAAEQKRERLQEEIVRLEQARNTEEEKWNKLVDGAEVQEEAKRAALKLPLNPQTKVERWMESDKAAVEKRAAKREVVEMKEYCSLNAERWMVCAEIEKLKKEADEAALNNSARLSDLRTHEARAKKRWSDLAYHEKSIVEARSKNTMPVEDALKELQKRDLIVYQLWTSMVPLSEVKFDLVTTVTAEAAKKTKKEIFSEDYFKEVEDTQNLVKEAAATKQYARAIKQEALQQALAAVLEDKESSVKALWHSKLVESAVAARQATLLAQRPPHPDWKTDEPRRLAQRTINITKANKAAFDAFHQEIERFSGIKMVWMARLEEAARSHAEGDATVWNGLTEEERNVYNAITVAKNKEKTEAIQKEIEEAEKDAEKAHRQVGEAWISSTKTAREEIAKTAEEKAKNLKTLERDRQLAIRLRKRRWGNLTSEEGSMEKFQEYSEVARKKAVAATDKKGKYCWNKVEECYDRAFRALKATRETPKGNLLFAKLSSETVQLSRELAIYFQKLAEVYSGEKDPESDHWKKIAADGCYASSQFGKILYFVGCDLDDIVKALEKVTTETIKGNLSLTELWSKQAVQSQELAEYNLRSADVQLNLGTYYSWYSGCVFSFTYHSRKSLNGAEACLGRATAATAEGNSLFAELWSKIAAEYQESFEYFRKAIEASLSGNKAEANRLNKVADSARDSAGQLTSSTKALEKATSATAEGNSLFAELWSKVATQYQES
ncbi:MAG TPA: hypothetical protein VJK54_06420, partial [Chthoniobacterales bacterium]|nr:hypothetical protein [Chthoniobacterales bacterium]